MWRWWRYTVRCLEAAHCFFVGISFGLCSVEATQGDCLQLAGRERRDVWRDSVASDRGQMADHDMKPSVPWHHLTSKDRGEEDLLYLPWPLAFAFRILITCMVMVFCSSPSQESGVRSQESGVRSQESGVDSQHIITYSFILSTDLPWSYLPCCHGATWRGLRYHGIGGMYLGRYFTST